MSGFLKALQKVGLVTVDSDGEEAVMLPVSEEPVPSEAAYQSTAGSQQSAAPSGGAISEGQPFDSFYADIQPSPYPAEKMLKLLDGLQAMDAATRLAAVKAIDQADDNWTIDDPVSDARQKIAALTGQASAFIAQVTVIEKDTEAAIKALEGDNDKAVSAIRKQIADMEALLARQVEKSSSDKTGLQNQLQAAREACTRETGRLHAEASRLHGLIDLFDTAVPK